MSRAESKMTDAGGKLTSKIPVEQVARQPPPGMAIPSSIKFSADDRLITYLFSPEGGLTQQLFAFDPQTGEESLLVAAAESGTTEETVSPEEELRRERQRQRMLGVSQYSWAKKENRLMLPMRGGIYLMDEPGASLRELVASGGKPALDPQFSPDGRWVSYVRDVEIYIVPVEGGAPRQLTSGARGTGRTQGLAEYIAQEEMGRRRGYWWSGDSKYIAFTEVDETHIPVYRIMHQGKDQTDDSAQEEHRYPFTGAENAKLRLGVVSLEGGEPVWMDYSVEEYEYLARVIWLPDGSLSAQLENREQTELVLVRFDPVTGERRTLLRETSEVWINLHDMFKPVEKIDGDEPAGFIWASERTGFRHLYLYDWDGNLVRPLTSGEWVVDALAGVDQENEKVYFTASMEDPRESHLYMVPFSGVGVTRLTFEAGVHNVIIDHGSDRFVDIHSALDRPPLVELRSLSDGALLRMIFNKPDARVEALGLQPPELVTLKSRDGIKLYGALYRPPEHFGEGPYPTVISVYGGPHAQTVSNQWGVTAGMRDQFLASLGFLVFRLDNRGMARRGLEFEGWIKHRLAHYEVKDQVDGVNYLVERGLADPERVGVFGWSYGGYMSLMCLTQEPDVFKVAVAGAPVTDQDGYDTHYTERYMGTPQSNPDGYKKSSVFSYVKNMKGKLLLIHGLIDENVHFRHTARLINALIAEGKPYDLLLLPDSRHGPRKPADILYLVDRLGDYFLQNL